MNQSREGLYLSAGFLLALLTKAPPLRPQQASWNPPSSPEGRFFEECVTGKDQMRAAHGQKSWHPPLPVLLPHLGEGHSLHRLLQWVEWWPQEDISVS